MYYINFIGRNTVYSHQKLPSQCECSTLSYVPFLRLKSREYLRLNSDCSSSEGTFCNLILATSAAARLIRCLKLLSPRLLAGVGCLCPLNSRDLAGEPSFAEGENRTWFKNGDSLPPSVSSCKM